MSTKFGDRGTNIKIIKKICQITGEDMNLIFG